jgi:hypothetical protein
VARVQVFYPTDDAPDCGRKYAILSPDGPFEVTSPLCAVEAAEVAPGPFPLIVYDHGGFIAGADIQRVAQAPVHELLASHGFIVFVALHSANPVARVHDLSLLIDLALERSTDPGDPLDGRVDADRIGVYGFSAGGGSALGVAGGWAAQGIAADPRVKAMVLYEPSIPSLDDAATISIPYLIMGGTQFVIALAVPALFDATTAAVPRIYVKSPGAVHFNYNTSLCDITEETREAALLADPLLPEPLTNFIAGNPAAIVAFTNWNLGAIQFPFSGVGFGGARNVCNRIGVDSVRSLDTSPVDGFTDSPPFMVTDAVTLAPAIPAEIMVPVVNLYTVAFWKAYLEGDHDYKAYLKSNYARKQGLSVEVTFRD